MKRTLAHTPNFDRIARAYRWFEYLTLGPLLQQTRNHYLPALGTPRHALILGDGDGRFTRRLLGMYPNLHADAVDGSASMLSLLHRRTLSYSDRLQIHHADIRTLTPNCTYDLVITHFLLDCLTEPEVFSFISRLTPSLAPGTTWLVSEFRVPPGLLHWPARLYIRVLYLAFRILTGLRITHLPDFATPLRAAGFTRIVAHRTALGLLTTEIWRRP